MSHELDILATVTAWAPSSLHIVRHSFGDAIVLVFALENPKTILSLKLLEPNPLCFLREGQFFEAQLDIDFMYVTFCNVMVQQNPDAAQLVIDFYGGAGFMIPCSDWSNGLVKTLYQPICWIGARLNPISTIRHR
jgi:hypothetical protein